MTAFTESVVEEAALEWLAALQYAVVHGPDIAPGEPFVTPYMKSTAETFVAGVTADCGRRS